MDTLKVRNANDVEQAVRQALAADQPLEVIGHGGKRAIGLPTIASSTLDLSALCKVTAYEPSELIITVQTGTPIEDVEALLDAQNQELAFEPMNTAPLMGTSAGKGSIGGMISAGFAGPRRIKAGGARDHLLGAAAVSGFGEAFTAGGKVVKNVTGYDICKLLAGSWGTLSVLTEVTLKVMPRAETERTLILRGLDDITANRAMTMALGSSFDASAAAHLPASTLHDASAYLPGFYSGRRSVTLVRLEGIDASVLDRMQSVSAMLSVIGPVEVTDEQTSRAVWTAVRDVLPFSANGTLGAWPVWRIVCPPAQGAVFGQALVRETGGDIIYDWGGGLIWAALPPSKDAGAGSVRQLLKTVSGHATLIRASADVRASVDVFHPQLAGVAALSKRVKSSFDPKGILNRGRIARAW